MAEIERGRRVVLKGGPCDGRVIDIAPMHEHWKAIVVPVEPLWHALSYDLTDDKAAEPIQTARYTTDGTYIP